MAITSSFVSASRVVVALLLSMLMMEMMMVGVESQACSKPCCGALPQGGYGYCNPGQCCSQFNYCGSQSQYCGRGCQRAYGHCSVAANTASSPAPKVLNITAAHVNVNGKN